MAGLSIGERARVARAAAADVKRRGVARVLGSPMMRWRYGAPIADALTLVPHSLRPADPVFAAEIASGSFGLAGTGASCGGFTPFEITPPSIAWARELHGFGWLCHLEADATAEGAERARHLVEAWIARGVSHPAAAFEPAVVGRRIISWLQGAAMLLDNVDQATFDRTATSLVMQLKGLAGTWASAGEGYARLAAIIGVVYGDLCIAGHERSLDASEQKLAAELDRQILPDGGHVSRNPAVLAELLLDLVPLRHCYLTLKRPVPPEFDSAIGRLNAMVRYLRLGDGSLARFNGVGAASVAEIGCVLAYDAQPDRPLEAAPQSRYVRLEAGSVVLVADAGSPPPLELGAQAHAGCLSFELSVGASPLFVNGGWPRDSERALLGAARSTSAHNTAVIGDRSSATLVRHEHLERLAGDAPLRMSGSVHSAVQHHANEIVWTASHEGYLAELGLVHAREITLDRGGAWLRGSDRLGGAKGALRLARDVPFAIHFHIDWQADAAIGADERITIGLADGSLWVFSATGAELSLEPTMHYADPAGAIRSRQIVLRGACYGEADVAWRLDRLQPWPPFEASM